MLGEAQLMPYQSRLCGPTELLVRCGIEPVEYLSQLLDEYEIADARSSKSTW
jgi:hypothetical protein